MASVTSRSSPAGAPGTTGPAIRPARPREIVRPRDVERASRGGGLGGGRGAQGQRPRLGALVHRGGDDRRLDDPDRRPGRGDRRRPRLGPGQGRRRHRAGRPQPGAGGARAGDGEPRRHRPPDDRRRDLDRDPRHRRRPAQHLRPGRGDRVGARRRQRPGADGRGRARAAEGRPGRRRGPGGDLLGHPALRPGLHPSSDRPAAATGGGARLLLRAGRRQRPLRVLRLPLHRLGADHPPQPHRARAAPARAR